MVSAMQPLWLIIGVNSATFSEPLKAAVRYPDHMLSFKRGGLQMYSMADARHCRRVSWQIGLEKAHSRRCSWRTTRRMLTRDRQPDGRMCDASPGYTVSFLISIFLLLEPDQFHNPGHDRTIPVGRFQGSTPMANNKAEAGAFTNTRRGNDRLPITSSQVGSHQSHS